MKHGCHDATITEGCDVNKTLYIDWEQYKRSVIRCLTCSWEQVYDMQLNSIWHAYAIELLDGTLIDSIKDSIRRGGSSSASSVLTDKCLSALLAEIKNWDIRKHRGLMEAAHKNGWSTISIDGAQTEAYCNERGHWEISVMRSVAESV